MLTTTSRSLLPSILATAALIGYVCLVMTCLAVATEDHCNDQHCSEMGNCHCACGLWSISPSTPSMPQPHRAELLAITEYHPDPIDRIADLFRPPRVIHA